MFILDGLLEHQTQLPVFRAMKEDIHWS
jgi:hypothetical protein